MDKNKEILIIEDDTFLGNALLQKLKKEGYKVHLSVDGKEGFDNISRIKPDLILLDILLPHMNGYEILEAKKEDNEIADIPVIVISNSGQPVEINRALALGVKDYLIKAQFDPKEVFDKVEKLFEKERQAKKDSSYSVDDGVLEEDTEDILEDKKILWVEDDPLLSDIVAQKLSGQKSEFIHVKTGEKCLDYLNDERPDIIVLDIALPEMTGLEVLEKIKNNEEWKDIPVIILSNLSGKEEMEKSEELKPDRFLVKTTLNLDQILDELRKVLKERSK